MLQGVFHVTGQAIQRGETVHNIVGLGILLPQSLKMLAGSHIVAHVHQRDGIVEVLFGTASTQFKTAEEHFDYAVSLMNVGDYVTAREHLETLRKQNAKADYVVYGLAALDCLTGHVEDSLRRLDEALRMNAQLRFQARNDSDFQNLAEDPRFTELLYPDPGADMESEAGLGEEIV